jgi:hypothetical protein
MRTERAARCAGEAERTTSFKKIERAVVFSGETKSHDVLLNHDVVLSCDHTSRRAGEAHARRATRSTASDGNEAVFARETENTLPGLQPVPARQGEEQLRGLQRLPARQAENSARTATPARMAR